MDLDKPTNRILTAENAVLDKQWSSGVPTQKYLLMSLWFFVLFGMKWLKSATLQINCTRYLCYVSIMDPHCRNYIIFSMTQILREIKVGNSRVLQICHLQIEKLWNLKLWIFCLFWRLKFTKLTHFRASRMAKVSVVGLLDSPKLISRKILVS